MSSFTLKLYVGTPDLTRFYLISIWPGGYKSAFQSCKVIQNMFSFIFKDLMEKQCVGFKFFPSQKNFQVILENLYFTFNKMSSFYLCRTVRRYLQKIFKATRESLGKRLKICQFKDKTQVQNQLSLKFVFKIIFDT